MGLSELSSDSCIDSGPGCQEAAGCTQDAWHAHRMGGLSHIPDADRRVVGSGQEVAVRELEERVCRLPVSLDDALADANIDVPNADAPDAKAVKRSGKSAPVGGAAIDVVRFTQRWVECSTHPSLDVLPTMHSRSGKTDVIHIWCPSRSRSQTPAEMSHVRRVLRGAAGAVS